MKTKEELIVDSHSSMPDPKATLCIISLVKQSGAGKTGNQSKSDRLFALSSKGRDWLKGASQWNFLGFETVLYDTVIDVIWLYICQKPYCVCTTKNEKVDQDVWGSQDGRMECKMTSKFNCTTNAMTSSKKKKKKNFRTIVGKHRVLCAQRPVLVTHPWKWP